jgi:hypothetical protein
MQKKSTATAKTTKRCGDLSGNTLLLSALSPISYYGQQRRGNAAANCKNTTVKDIREAEKRAKE